MLYFISWQQYLLAIATAGFLYYLIVLLAYYRKNVTASFARERLSRKQPRTEILGEAKPDVHDPIRTSELEFISGDDSPEQQNQN